MSSLTLKQYLEDNHVVYSVTSHLLAYRAPEVALSSHIPARDLAKTVVVTLDKALAMVVIPAPGHVSTSLVKQFTGATKVSLAPEDTLAVVFPDCELGAMPPFGNLYGLPVYVDESLVGRQLTFNAGTHLEVLTIDWDDFQRLVKPQAGSFLATVHDNEAADCACVHQLV